MGIWNYSSTKRIIFIKIEPFSLFSSVRNEPIQIYDYKPEDFKLEFLIEGDKAFKDKDNFILYDIPVHHKGAFMLRADFLFLTE